MGVGIPGTGMIGLPIAVALGALIGKSEYQLEVLKDLTPATLERGKQYLAGDHINIQLKQGECDKLYIESICETTGNHATAIIEGGHTATSSRSATARSSPTAAPGVATRPKTRLSSSI